MKTLSLNSQKSIDSTADKKVSPSRTKSKIALRLNTVDLSMVEHPNTMKNLNSPINQIETFAQAVDRKTDADRESF